MGTDEHRGDVGPTLLRQHYLIGLTGNIATGKSAVAAVLRKLGAHVIDADRIAHQVMVSNVVVKQTIAREFGEGVLTPQAEIDRSALGCIVFEDAEALQRLERIVHPPVIQAIDALILQAEETVVVVEAIKLIETGMYRRYDALWVVTAPVEQQVERLTTQRGLTEAEALLRIAAQPPQSEKMALADVIIDNGGSLQNMEQQVWAEWEKIQQQLAQSTATGK